MHSDFPAELYANFGQSSSLELIVRTEDMIFELLNVICHLFQRTYGMIHSDANNEHYKSEHPLQTRGECTKCLLNFR